MRIERQGWKDTSTDQVHSAMVLSGCTSCAYSIAGATAPWKLDTLPKPSISAALGITLAYAIVYGYDFWTARKELERRE